MPRANILVVYYSRSGTTETVARAIAEATGAGVEPLVDTVNRGRALGFVRSVRDAASRRQTTLQPLSVDPADYDLVVVGTPDWGKSVSAPVRTFLAIHAGRLRQVAFFLTDGEAEHARVFREMASLVGREPVAQLGIPHDEVDRGAYREQLAAFLESLPTAHGHVRPAKT